MQITAVFDSIEEMKVFAGRIMETENEVQEAPAEQQKPAPQKAAYGQQIAEHFPEANSPVAQQAVQPATQAPASPTQQQPVQAPQVQTTATTYKPDDLAAAAMQLMDRGMQTQLQQLLTGYGVASLPELQPEQYGNFATALRGLGAQI